jgi:hypothetical protein
MDYYLCLQLKKEIMDLALQRDLAHSQIKDMLQVVGDDMSSSDLVSIFAYSKALKLAFLFNLIYVQHPFSGKFGSPVPQTTCAKFSGL